MTLKFSSTGFSSVEVLIAVTITLAVMVAASTLLATSQQFREGENERLETLVAAQRALRIMAREIGNSGLGLTDNGIVFSDSGSNSIRVRANTNQNSTLADPDEDVRYLYQVAKKRIVRFDRFPAPGGSATVLANRIVAMTLTYRDANGTQLRNPANYGAAAGVTVDLRVELPAERDEPASVVRLVSEVPLQNAPNRLQQK